MNWLVRQLEFAEAGADAVLGSVEPDPDGMDPELLRRWLERHPFHENHPHIYGANFGVRASAYLAAGGFARVRPTRTAPWSTTSAAWPSRSRRLTASGSRPPAGPRPYTAALAPTCKAWDGRLPAACRFRDALTPGLARSTLMK